MQRCIDLAQLGLGHVSPNPMVGCVIVHNNNIIGEGWHQKYGAPHAEVNAVSAVLDAYGEQAADLLKDSTVYVSLEPCAHFGKTPPCADLLIKYSVKKVVVGSRDPFPEVDGKGISKLRNAGIEVELDVLKAQCDALNKRFFTRVQKQRPYVILKWAQTSNGFFAPLENEKKWITGPESSALNHKWRSEEDAILVGKNTAIVDNPSLTVRNWKGRNPLRILIDKNLEVATLSNIYNSEAKTLVINSKKTDVFNNINYIEMEDMQFYLAPKVLYQLHLMDVQSVIIEGGLVMLNHFIEANLWDEARILIGPNTWQAGKLAPNLQATVAESQKVGEDTLNILYNT